MSSNRLPRTLRLLLVAGLATQLAACAGAPKPSLSKADPPRLPTEQFTPTLDTAPAQILLAPHMNGLSPAQTAALSGLADNWRDDGQGPITVRAPASGGEAADRSQQAVEAALIGFGVPQDQIETESYDAQDPGAPLKVGYDRLQASVPECGRKWDAFTRSAENEPNNNFGCAVSANFAAMVADPADLEHPRASTPADAQRREIILGKYRNGETTSSTKDDQANGAISTAVQ